jgi:hypothetical protein
VQFSYNDTTGVLTAILDVSAADKILYSTAADAWAEAAITSFGRSLIDDADAATARATLGITVYDQETTEDIVAAVIIDSSTIDATYNDGAGTLSLAVIQSALDHGSIGGLGDDDHTIYVLLAGRSGGQTVVGGTASGNALKMSGSTHATKGGVRVYNDNFIAGSDNTPGATIEARKASGSASLQATADDTTSFALVRPINDAGDQIQFWVFGSAYAANVFGIAAAHAGALLYANTAAATYFFLGSVGAHPMIIGYNSAEVARTSSTGLDFANAKTITIDNIAARDADGLLFKDDGGNVAIDIDDGGGVNFLGPIVINDAGADKDVRIEGDTDANLFMLDASADVIGIGIAAPAAKLHIAQSSLGSEVQRLESVATNDDPRESVYQNRVTTTDATVTTLHTFTIAASTTYCIEVRVIARRTGGSSGTAEDGAVYRRVAAVKNVSGTATLIGTIQGDGPQEDQAAWDCTIDVTSNTARCRVTGAANNNITWHMTAHVWSVGS